MRYLNGFILIGIALLIVSIAGFATGNRFLTEPGQPVNPYSALEYLGGAVLMLINGGVSIWNVRQQEPKTSARPEDAPDHRDTDPNHDLAHR